MLSILSIATIGVLALIAKALKRNDLLDVINLLFFMTMCTLVTPDNTEAEQLSYGLLTFAALNLGLSRFGILRKRGIRSLVGVVGAVILLFLLGDGSIKFGEFSFSMFDKVPMALLIGGVVALELSDFKLDLINRWFGADIKLERSLIAIFTGVVAFFGLFQAGSAGILIASAAVISASFYFSDRMKEPLAGLIVLASLGALMIDPEGNSISASLIAPEIVEGLFVGAFGMYFLQSIWKINKNRVIGISLAYMISLGLVIALLAASQILPHAGGQDAVAASVLGASVVATLSGEGLVSTSFFGFALSATLFIAPNLIDTKGQEEAKELEELEVQIENELSDLNDLSPDTLSVQDSTEVVMEEPKWQSGNYTIDKGSSLVSFKLGPEGGVTKGAFKNFTGKVNLGDAPENTKISVELPTKSLTTFNQMRDDHLMAEEYLNEKKHPMMSFNGNGLKQQANGSYSMQGKFTMLGVTSNQSLVLKFVDKDGKKKMIGSGQLDRRDFGMESAPSEGNVVEFNFSVELR